MRKITKEAVSAFVEREMFSKSNTSTDGRYLRLHNNTIAYWGNGDDLWVSTAGWNTVTTRERLNGLPGVSVCMKRGQLYLNGEKWDGGWKLIPDPNKL